MPKRIRLTLLPAVALALIGGGWALFNEASTVRTFPEMTVEALASEPIFEDLAENHVRNLKRARAEGRFAHASELSRASEKIDWAEDIYDAIERGRAEDKPIFVVTHCRENCDDKLDV